MRRKRNLKKLLAFTLAGAMVISGAGTTNQASAKTKTPALAKKKVTVKVGKTKKIKIKNYVKGLKAKITVKKKAIAKVKQKKNKIVVKAKKAGATNVILKLTYKVNGKKVTKKVKLKVKVKAASGSDSTSTATATATASSGAVTTGSATATSNPSATAKTSSAPSSSSSTPGSSDTTANPSGDADATETSAASDATETSSADDADATETSSASDTDKDADATETSSASDTDKDADATETSSASDTDKDADATETTAAEDADATETTAADDEDADATATTAADDKDADATETTAADDEDADATETTAADDKDEDAIETTAADDDDADASETSSADAGETESPESGDDETTASPASTEEADADATSTPRPSLSPGEAAYSENGFTSEDGTTIDSDDVLTTADEEDAVYYEITIDSDSLGTKETVTNEAGNTIYEISKKGKLTIFQPGEFVVSTTGSNAIAKNIEVDIDSETYALVDGASDILHIVLNGVNYEVESTTSEEVEEDGVTTTEYGDDAVIKIKKTTDISKVVITAAEGTTNYLTQTGTTSTDTDGESYYALGILSKKVPLTINGSGSIIIKDTYGTGIKVSDYTEGLKVLDAVLNITAGHVGIQTKTNGYFANTDLTVYAVDDAIKTTIDEDDVNDTDESMEAGDGLLEFYGGTFDITSEDGDGISAAYTMNEGATNEASYGCVTLNPTTMEVVTGVDVVQVTSSDDVGSRKGIKSGYLITVAEDAGTISVDTTKTEVGTSGSSGMGGEATTSEYADDAFHSNEDIVINGGTLNIAAADDGVHADNNLTVNDCTMNMTEAYEGLEAAYIDVNDGTLTINTSDDGMNAAGGSDSQSTEGGNWGPGGGNQSSSSTNYYLKINGGTINVYAGGDGLDSNKALYINGGDTVVYSTQNNGNSALDYDGTLEINGGTILAVSAGQGMDEGNPSGSQTYIKTSISASAGNTLTITDSSNKTIASYTLEYSAVQVIYSSSSLTKGSSYTVKAGNSSVSATAGSSSSGNQGPGGR
ncbi:MAG: carbohydrate-binding domain-containing protein [Lachnospiraceae bacterium]|nr:carbohydrate-binding domain-containing protein [Lachnospiraceae bacterium]